MAKLPAAVTLDPRAPVVVGVGSITQRPGDPAELLSATELMVAACERAGADSGAPGLLRSASLVLVPHGTWRAANPARRVAERLGSDRARTVQSEIGVLQQTLLTRACRAVATGSAEVAIVCGGEDMSRSRILAGVQPTPEPAVEAPVAPPEEVLVPGTELLSRTEVERDLAVPVRQYALIENSLRSARDLSLAEQRKELGALWAEFARVAADRSEAWDRRAPSAEEIVTPGRRNRMLCSPYTKALCSQWNLDQAAAVVVASADAASAAGVPPDRWVFPVSAAESNHVVHLPRRPQLHRWPAFAACAERALELAGSGIGELALIDLYSCFPAAVRVQALELGLPLVPATRSWRQLTVTGGMTFAGGPLNNYVLQATVEMARSLRPLPGALGMVTSVSGMLSKPAVAIWSSTPPAHGFRAADTTGSDAGAGAGLPLDPDATGAAQVVASTVVFDRDEPARAVAVLEAASGARTVAVSDDTDIIASMLEQEWAGRDVKVSPAGRFS